MKNALIITTLLISLCTLHSKAETVGNFEFVAKVISFDKTQILVESDGKKFHVPRSSAKGDIVAGKKISFNLSRDQYEKIRGDLNSQH